MAKYLLLQHYEDAVACDAPMGTWDAADIRAHIDHQRTLNRELAAAGELIEAQGVAREARRVVSDGDTMSVGAPDGGRLLAGYRVVDVDTEQRALEIAARASAAPGPGGLPVQQPIEVRQVMVDP